MRAFVFALSVLFSAGAFAEEAGSEATSAGEEGRPKHALGLFVGVTRAHGENLATRGVEYSYRFHENWSVGGFIERAERDQRTTLVMAFIDFFPWKGLFLGAGVGRKDPVDEERNTLRAGIGYEFEIGGGWSIAPAAAVDFIEHEGNEEVYGIGFGKRF